MGIIEEYDNISKEQLSKNEHINEYQNELDENITKISNFQARNTIFSVLIHPIRAIKSKIELNRLKNTKIEFQKALDASLVMYMEEESGVLEDDLTRAMLYTKPKILKKFIDENPSKNLTLKDKKD